MTESLAWPCLAETLREAIGQHHEAQPVPAGEDAAVSVPEFRPDVESSVCESRPEPIGSCPGRRVDRDVRRNAEAFPDPEQGGQACSAV